MKSITDRVKIVQQEQQKYKESATIIDKNIDYLSRKCKDFVVKAWKKEFPDVSANIESDFMIGSRTVDGWEYGVTIFEVNGLCASNVGWLKRGPPVDFPPSNVLRELPTRFIIDLWCFRWAKKLGVPVRLWRANYLLKEMKLKEEKKEHANKRSCRRKARKSRR